MADTAKADLCTQSLTSTNGTICPSDSKVATRFSSHISPVRLPKHNSVPAAISLAGEIEGTNGTHPPALREAAITIDRDVTIDVIGFPACHADLRDIRRPPGWLRKVCGAAIVGQGTAGFEIAFPAQPAVQEESGLTIYNGGVSRGVTTLYAVAYITAPSPSTVAMPMTLKKVHKGQYGLQAVARMPRLADGMGSLVNFDLKLQRLSSFKGQRKSFVTARCADTKLEIGFPRLLFKNEAEAAGTPQQSILSGTTSSACTPRG